MPLEDLLPRAQTMRTHKEKSHQPNRSGQHMGNVRSLRARPQPRSHSVGKKRPLRLRHNLCLQRSHPQALSRLPDKTVKRKDIDSRSERKRRPAKQNKEGLPQQMSQCSELRWKIWKMELGSIIQNLRYQRHNQQALKLARVGLDPLNPNRSFVSQVVGQQQSLFIHQSLHSLFFAVFHSRYFKC